MKRFVREVPADGRLEAAAQAMSWGYPREIEDSEAETTTWVQYGPDVLVWYMDLPIEGALAVHACAAPSARGAMGTERQMIAMEIVGELLGAERLYSLTGLADQFPHLPRKAMRRYLRMRGWAETDWCSYRELGG